MRFVLLTALLLTFGCDRTPPIPPTTVTNTGPPKAAGDAAMLAKFQCNRCHIIDGIAPTTVNMDCRECHRQIIDRTYVGEPAEYLAMWDKGLENMRDVPSLRAVGERLNRQWFVAFVQEPVDLRPRLGAMMPRLAVSGADAERLADALGLQKAEAAAIEGDLEAGRRVLETRGCASCHVMSGLEKPLKPSEIPVQVEPKRLARATYLAPDLRHTRARFRSDRIVAWLQAPEKLKSDALMPNLALTEQEARDAAAFILQAPLQPSPPATAKERLPVLKRQVVWGEVQQKLVDEICLHCHSDPKYNEGDGGPGSTGGLGYAGKKLDLSTYDRAVRDRSFYAAGPDGVPKIVAHLMARHEELAGRPTDVLGMPLGFPAIDLERIQLLETWIAQGLKE